jgi:hypothetical protein
MGGFVVNDDPYQTDTREQLETEMTLARSYVRQCRDAGDDQAAQLHVVWIDLLLEEWDRLSLHNGQSMDPLREPSEYDRE